ncbi:divalent-cation tolerance protein CutA [Alkalinema sp. FACHB-956]|uniref:divalent-cation tolerance protein CutA n=1 Tax=Alkalinema sp. FACHB-956 TaxID=2692768 RepID=UPI0016870045|nr:divalent-cation tolerance protein CutA [Alkalinema sp. FACHB-956]MBD2326835.1 divalent-cation tolerance protein CutA [Alkalinema sp. FACHB-956]
MAETSQYCTVLVTVPNGTIAETIAHALLEAKLAACVSLFPVTSIYTWQGEVQQEGELQLLIKTELARFGEIDAMVRSLHPYEVPEVIALPIVAGSLPYLQWIAEQVTGA